MVFKTQKTKVGKGATAPSQRRFALAHLRTVAWTTSVIGNVHNLLALLDYQTSKPTIPFTEDSWLAW